jgi:hypothetical protein
MHAERIQESGNNYGAFNPGSRAAGAYQFEPATWNGALLQAGLGASQWVGRPANQAPPWVQDAAAAALMGGYYNDFGHSWFNVAEAWYGGPGAIGHPGRGGGPGYPDVGQYANQVMAIYRSLGGANGGGAVTPVTPPPSSGEWNAALTTWNVPAHIYSVSLPNLNIDLQRTTQW